MRAARDHARRIRVDAIAQLNDSNQRAVRCVQFGDRVASTLSPKGNGTIDNPHVRAVRIVDSHGANHARIISYREIPRRESISSIRLSRRCKFADLRFGPESRLLDNIPTCYSLTMVIDKPDNLNEKADSDSSIVFRLDARSGVPTYLQLVQQVENAIRLGYLRRGDQIPRIKDVVASLSINPNTVLKAYRDLEQKGLIGARPGLGTFVEAEPETVGLSELTTLRRSLVTGWLREAAELGLDEDGIVALFTNALRDFRRDTDEPRLKQPRRRVASGAMGGVA